jgi:hypothetical protein
MQTAYVNYWPSAATNTTLLQDAITADDKQLMRKEMELLTEKLQGFVALFEKDGKLFGAPVAALKIEGRMRSPGYVAAVTGIYRRALDAIGAGTWTPSPGDEEALAVTFNRGFTGGCLCEGPEGIMGRDAPGHRGILAGIVESLDERSGFIAVRLTGSMVPEKGDGLVFREHREDEKAGMILREDPVVDDPCEKAGGSNH